MRRWYDVAGRRICKFYVDTALQMSGYDGAYGGGCCVLPTLALFTSRRPPGDVALPFYAHIGSRGQVSAGAYGRAVPNL